jgi:WW domain-containing oxidoreductase
LTEPDNLDSHFVANMLSQLHLALMLLPTLKATAETIGRPYRLVLMSSEMHSFSPSSTEFSSVKGINTDFGATELYARSKLAQILITRELARRLDKGELGFSQTPSHRLVIVNATHPGGVKTPQQDQMPAAYGETAGKVITKMVRPLLTDPIRHGCRSELFAATSLKMFEGEGVHGQYIMSDKKISEVSKKGQDDAMATRLWNLSIGLLREKVGTLGYGLVVGSMLPHNAKQKMSETASKNSEHKNRVPSHLFLHGNSA